MRKRPPIPLLLSKRGMFEYAKRRGYIPMQAEPTDETTTRRWLAYAGITADEESRDLFRLVGTGEIERYRSRPLYVLEGEYKRYIDFLDTLPPEVRVAVEEEVGEVIPVSDMDTLQHLLVEGANEKERVINALIRSQKLAVEKAPVKGKKRQQVQTSGRGR